MTVKKVGVLLVFCFLTAAFADENVRVAMNDIQVLHFNNGRMTKGRRGPPVPQMECVRGACHRASDVMRTAICKNVGSNGVSPVWKCESDLPNGYDLGEITVSCEGWDGPGDPYVLAGSCQLEYELVESAPQRQAPRPSPEPKGTPCTLDDSYYVSFTHDPKGNPWTPGDPCVFSDFNDEPVSENTPQTRKSKATGLLVCIGIVFAMVSLLMTMVCCFAYQNESPMPGRQSGRPRTRRAPSPAAEEVVEEERPRRQARPTRRRASPEPEEVVEEVVEEERPRRQTRPTRRRVSPEPVIIEEHHHHHHDTGRRRDIVDDVIVLNAVNNMTRPRPSYESSNCDGSSGSNRNSSSSWPSSGSSSWGSSSSGSSNSSSSSSGSSSSGSSGGGGTHTSTSYGGSKSR